MKKRTARSRRRLLIATDGRHWYVRRIASVTHDGDSDVMIYHCDKPIGRRFKMVADAVRIAKSAMSNKQSKAWR